MISAVRPCVPAGATRRAAPGARPAPLAARRTSLRVRASYEPDDKSKFGSSGGGVKKDLSDVSSPSQLTREAAPSYAPAFIAAPLLPAFTRRREAFAGRLAMIGFAAACVWEIITPAHVGPMGVTAALTGLSVPTVKAVFAAFVAHGVLGLLWPGAPTFDRANTVDYMKRPEGPPSLAVNPITHPAKFFGCSPFFGFTKANELLHGRLAMLGFLAAVVNEAQTGMGPIGQVAWWMGNSNPGDDWYRSAGLALLGFAAVMTGAAYLSGHAGSLQGEEDIY